MSMKNRPARSVEAHKRSGLERLLFVIFLQRLDIELPVEKRFEAGHHRRCTRHGRHRRNLAPQRLSPDGDLIVLPPPPPGSVDDQLDLAVLDKVDDVGPPFVHLSNGVHRHWRRR